PPFTEYDAGHGLGRGSALRASAIAALHRRSGAGGAATTGSESATSPSSGMQTSAQTSQLASARRSMRWPASSVAGGVTRIGSSTSLLNPKLTTGPTGMRSGTGHAMSSATKPGGSDHASVTGSPEPPGLRQYVCQPG